MDASGADELLDDLRQFQRSVALDTVTCPLDDHHPVVGTAAMKFSDVIVVHHG